MWLPRKTYEDLWKQLLTSQAEARAGAEANKTLAVTMDWLRVRVTQLEKERAVMVEKFYGVKVAVPEIIAAPDPFANHPFNELPSFDGLSDQDAARLGIEHDAEGHLIYRK